MHYHPETTTEARSRGTLTLRFEDVAQDGRLLLEPIPASLGVLWRDVEPTAMKWVRQGVVPILSRLEITAGDGPFGVSAPVEVEGRFTLAHDVDAAGAVSRLFFDAEAELWGVVGRTTVPPPEDAGRRVFAGRLRVEHTFTRPFAAAEERRVVSIDEDGRSYVPGRRRPWRDPASALTPPAGATPLDADFTVDPTPLPLGLLHTDSNQHVNSLFYPRAFEEAALRRLASLGRSTEVLGRSLDVAFRKPSFAGETLHVALRAYEHDGAVVLCGGFLGPESRDVAKARVFVRLTLT